MFSDSVGAHIMPRPACRARCTDMVSGADLEDALRVVLEAAAQQRVGLVQNQVRRSGRQPLPRPRLPVPGAVQERVQAACGYIGIVRVGTSRGCDDDKRWMPEVRWAPVALLRARTSDARCGPPQQVADDDRNAMSSMIQNSCRSREQKMLSHGFSPCKSGTAPGVATVTSGGRCGGRSDADTTATLTSGSPSVGRRRPRATAATCSHSAMLGHKIRAPSAAAALRTGSKALEVVFQNQTQVTIASNLSIRDQLFVNTNRRCLTVHNGKP